MQMRFWKWYNNIEGKPLKGDDESGAGTPGDKIISLGDTDKNGKSDMTWHQYFSNDEISVNYYNYTIVRDLPHTVEQRLIPEAWEFIKRFSRKADGNLKIKE